MLHYLMWCIWWERNSRSFEGRERSILEFKSFFFWTMALGKILTIDNLRKRHFVVLELVFYVQKVWGICRSSPPSLSYSL